VRAVAAGGFYTANVAQAYWPHLIRGEPIGVLWSLAEEEQFYLLWPLALIVLLAFGVRRRFVMIGLVAAILAIIGERGWLLAMHANNTRIYTSPESAADSLLAGVLVAFVLRKKLERRIRVLAAIGIALYALVTFLGFVITYYGPAVDLGGAVLVVLPVRPSRWTNTNRGRSCERILRRPSLYPKGSVSSSRW
jgi:peptidoglycan/LPS O-acetylase OafA/YrhL